MNPEENKPQENLPVSETPVSEIPTETVPASPAAPETQAPPDPQVIVEKGVAHYVGFAFIVLFAVFFFFIPGISFTYLLSNVVVLEPAAVWILTAIFSVILWLILKLKIKGLKRPTYIYLGFCVFVFALLVLIYVLNENSNIFSGIFKCLGF
ncbi:MAG: hypothetical protein LBR60_01035 [Fibrobacter sp.]|jgi:hypothetical protein|nr:hypothetical protein [Fibrobacter sp.]